jgi:hypothetical protein
VVAESLFILVGRVVFFVDDDDPDIAEGREERAACAHGNGGVARAKALPLFQALAGLKAAMKHRQVVSEAPSESRHDLMGE